MIRNYSLQYSAVLVLATSSLFAQSGGNVVLNKSQRTQLISGLKDVLHAHYVDESLAVSVGNDLLTADKRGDFDQLSDPKQFAKTITQKLQELTHDQHLTLNFSDKPVQAPSTNQKPNPAEQEGLRNYGEPINFGFNRAERLPGNVAYLKLDLFFPVEFGADSAVAAMNWVAPAEALIIDLRANDSGSPDMMTLITSYLFDSKPVWYGGSYERDGNVTKQYWTMPYVPGKRFIAKDVFILTSKRTFSAAEGFAYNLQALKRAVIVGENTGGGAHPRDVFPLSDHFWAGIPVARGVNPITGTDWEGTGVHPDISCSSADAVRTALVAALNDMRNRATSEDDRARFDQARKNVEQAKSILPQ